MIPSAFDRLLMVPIVFLAIAETDYPTASTQKHRASLIGWITRIRCAWRDVTGRSPQERTGALRKEQDEHKQLKR